MGAADCFGGRFRKTEKTHLALFDQARHGPDCLFNRHIGINAMLIEQVDFINAEPLQALVTALRDIFRPAIRALQSEIAEFRSQNDA